MNKTMMDQFDSLEASLASTQATILSLGTRMNELEEATASQDQRLTNLEQVCKKMPAENEVLRSKVTDLEAHSRRETTRIVGLPEKKLGGRCSS